MPGPRQHGVGICDGEAAGPCRARPHLGAFYGRGARHQATEAPPAPPRSGIIEKLYVS